MLKLVNIRLPLGFNDDDLMCAVSERLKVEPREIHKLIVDQRELIKGDIHFKVTALCELSPEKEERLALILRKKGVSLFTDGEYIVKPSSFKKRPVVVGFGPAGIFASLVLAESGACPIVLERGSDTERRMAQVAEFSQGGRLDPESNIQFGEGGAGAFSDGKLKVGYKDARKRRILRDLVEAGADSSILYLEKPHVGSDVLHKVMIALRKKLISLGGEVHFDSKAVNLIHEGGHISGIEYEQGGRIHRIETDSVILAIGHSARDTYEYLHHLGIKMEAKGFGVGVRIEHPQKLVNKLEYGNAEYANILGSADYKMVVHLENGRSLYTFCMCPGGYVVPASSEEKSICTNGMSEFARDGENANTALLVSVTPDDFPSDHPLAGIEYQRKIERLAFNLGGGDYSAPVIRLEDFLEGRESTALGEVKPTYRPGTRLLSPDSYLPDYVCQTLRDGIREMCDWKEGYYCPDAVLTGPETRTTSPVRIVRNENMTASIDGLYPAGEGAGYAGGIISSAVDGMMCAEALIERNLK